MLGIERDNNDNFNIKHLTKNTTKGNTRRLY